MPYSEEDIRKVVQYLNQQTAAGYDLETLKNFLITQGYDKNLISASSDRAMLTAPKHTKLPNIDPKIIKFGLVAICGIIVIIAIFFFASKLGSNPESNENAPANTVKERTLAGVELDAPKKTIIKNTPKETGNNDADRISQEEPDTSAALDNSQEEFRQDEEGPNIMQIQSAIEQYDEQRGIELCRSLNNDQKINSCYKTMAVKYNKKEYCRELKSSSTRDSCLIVFAFSGDLTVCEQIENPYHLLTCRSLGRQVSYEETI